MALTKVTSGVRTLGTGEVTAANLAAGATSGLEDDVALLGFKVASNGSLAKYNLVDQTVDGFEDTSGVDASASTNEVRNSSNYYSGSADNTPTGGTETTHGLYSVNTFLADDNLVVSSSGNLDFLVVAGGGAGGGTFSGSTTTRCSGAGGAGGVRQISDEAVTAQTYAIVVGDGGAHATTDSTGSSGDTSSAAGISASGGGRGQNYNGLANASGGSGGGTSGGGLTGSSGNSGGYTPVEGYAGGSTDADQDGGSGGGGASEVGQNGNASGDNAGGNGGDGIQNAWRTGSNIYYGGGGGGGSADGEVGGIGGDGGGGAGGTESSGTGINGTANFGGGGGGAGEQTGGSGSSLGGDGGSGIVVVRALTSEWLVYNNMTLVSATTAAQEAPSKGDIVLTYTNGAGTTTLDTDLTAEISADGGSTWTDLPLTSEGSTGSHNIAVSHNQTIDSTITSPWNMAYRIKTLNQAVGKTTRIQAVSLGWS